MPGRYFIKTFGCQMNEYDSARMADVLHASAGLTATDDPAEADVLLMNTCSVREKAQEKVFSLLGEWRAAEKAAPGADHRQLAAAWPARKAMPSRRALRSSTWCSARRRLHRLPELIAERRRGGRAVVDISFPEIEKFDRLPAPRADGTSAYVSVMEGLQQVLQFSVSCRTRVAMKSAGLSIP